MALTLTCRFHPKYLAIRAPRKTTRFPNGCPGCNLIWGAVTASGGFVRIRRPWAGWPR